MITARTPQAKGRVERLWGTLQDRLVIELRIAGVETLEQANAFLDGFLLSHNERFSLPPADAERAYLPGPPKTVLEDVLALHDYRVAAADSTLSLDGRRMALVDADRRAMRLKKGERVLIITDLKGERRARVGERHFRLAPAENPPAPPRSEPSKKAETPPKPPRKLSEDHPWKKAARREYQMRLERARQAELAANRG